MPDQSTNSKTDAINDRIVRAAATCFIEKGYEGASTLTIANMAKTSKRELYKRYANKENLFESVMHYLCHMADDEAPTPDNPTNLRELLRQSAHAVVARFLQPETQGILIAAIAASGKFPNIINIFWNEGPGQAVSGIAEWVRQEASQEKLTCDDPVVVAREFIMSCSGPFVLSRMFDPEVQFSHEAISAHIESEIDKFMAISVLT